MFVHPDLFYFQAGSMAVAGRSDDAKFFIPEKEQAVIQMRLDLYRASVAFYQGDVDTFVELLDQNREGIEKFASIVNVTRTWFCIFGGSFL
jgi:LuxR family transcriptional regulator, maltose regulon positive regulatory protein